MKTLEISGMSCGMCVKHVTEAIATIPGVTDVQVSLENGNATFEFGEASLQKVIEAIREEGYEAKEA